ncbi:unnamed protein product [Victoria cruziana]
MLLWVTVEEQIQPHRDRERDDDEGLLLTGLMPMENHHPLTLLSMDSSSHDDLDREPPGRQIVLSRPPDINLPLSAERSPPPPSSWSSADGSGCGGGKILDVGLGSQIYESEALMSQPKPGRKCAKRSDSIWGAWFFFNFYFKPVFADKVKAKAAGTGGGAAASGPGFDKADLRLDVFLVQHDMENMYMWVFKERPENALGKMQLRSYMNGHSRPGEPQFPYSVDKGFVRSHRMQRKQYRGLSNPQCVHGIDVVRAPDLSHLLEGDLKKWMELTGRDLNFSIPGEASDFSSWRHLPSTDFELERPLPPPLKNNNNSSARRLLNGGLNLTNGIGNDVMELSPVCNKRKKEFFPHANDDDCCLPLNYTDRSQDVEIHQMEPPWLNDFSGVMRQAYGPVTAAKTIYEDEEGYLIVVSLPFADHQRVKVSWRNTLTHGIVKILCVSTARMPYIKRHDRTFKLTDPSPEHCPPGEFVREIPLATRIPEEAKLEAYYDEACAGLEILVPKHRVGPEEHEVRVCLRPHLGTNELLLT